MPNWVYNTLTIHESQKHLILNSNGNVDFNIIEPMPEEMRDFEPAFGNEEQVLYYLTDRMQDTNVNRITDLINEKYTGILTSELAAIYETDPKQAPLMNKADVASLIRKTQDYTRKMSEDRLNEMYESGEKRCRFYVQYGATHWYPWSLAHWGCKWNAGDTSVETDSDGTMTINFTTPWGAPDAWIKKLASYKIDFHLYWLEEQGYQGEFNYDSASDTFDVIDLEPESYNDEDEDEDDNNEE